MKTLHELSGIFLVVIAFGFLLFGCNFLTRSYRDIGWRAILWDLFCSVLLLLFFLAIYLVTSNPGTP